MKTCPYCGKIVDLKHDCPMKPKHSRRYDSYRDREARRIRRTEQWKRMSKLIRSRDGGIDQAAIHGLTGEPVIIRERLSVHHIEPIEERPDLAFDPCNLITLSPGTHELAERGRLSREDLHRIAEENTRNSSLF